MSPIATIIIFIILTVTGKLPVEVDMNWIPQLAQVEKADPSDIGSVVTESPPPRKPPKKLELNESAKHPVPNATPALPPKPKAY